MKVTDFTYLLQNPNKVIDSAQTNQLEDVLEEYPYFQAARALHLKGLKNLNSFKYNNALKVTAAYTADRDILFDFITSEAFLQNDIADTILGRSTPLNEKEIISEEVIPLDAKETALMTESEDEAFPQNKKEADQILDPSLFESKDPQVDKAIAEAKKKAATELAIGTPIAFTKKEKYSFSEWLQLTSYKTVDRETKKTPVKEQEDGKEFSLETDVLKKKKFELIDKFIASNPKIVPKENITKIDIKESIKIDRNELMTETLAKVYLEQKKYKKAIQAYKILSLKYPEKSGFFADRIKAVEQIQLENS